MRNPRDEAICTPKAYSFMYFYPKFWYWSPFSIFCQQTEIYIVNNRNRWSKCSHQADFKKLLMQDVNIGRKHSFWHTYHRFHWAKGTNIWLLRCVFMDGGFRRCGPVNWARKMTSDSYLYVWAIQVHMHWRQVAQILHTRAEFDVAATHNNYKN